MLFRDKMTRASTDISLQDRGPHAEVDNRDVLQEMRQLSAGDLRDDVATDGPIPVEVVVWGSADVQILTRMFKHPGPINIAVNRHKTTEELFDAIIRSLGAMFSIQKLSFEGHGNTGFVQTGKKYTKAYDDDGNPYQEKTKRYLQYGTADFAEFSMQFDRLLPYFEHGATISIGGCGSGFGRRGLQLLDELAKLGRSKELKVVAGTVAQRATPGIEGNDVYLQYKKQNDGYVRTGGVNDAYDFVLAGQRWMDAPLLVDDNLRQALESGNVASIKSLRNNFWGSIGSVAEFLAMLKVKKSYSYASYRTSRDPYLITQTRQGIRRSHEEHVAIFSPLTVEWFGRFNPIDRAALCAELNGDYKLPNVEDVLERPWFQKLVKNLEPPDYDQIKTLYHDAVAEAQTAYPEIFGEIR